jgi:hypothetical protein
MYVMGHLLLPLCLHGMEQYQWDGEKEWHRDPPLQLGIGRLGVPQLPSLQVILQIECLHCPTIGADGIGFPMPCLLL